MKGMDEASWLACGDPGQLLDFLGSKASPRKLRLFACGCCRAISYFINDRRRRAVVEVAERYADGEANSQELSHGQSGADFIGLSCAASANAFQGAVGWAKPGGMTADEASARADLLRDLFWPFQVVTVEPAWRSADVMALARAVYVGRDFSLGSMRALSDALEEAGCAEEAMLAHLRGPGRHVRGCRVVDLLLEKE
jgi:hypothetical protein